MNRRDFIKKAGMAVLGLPSLSQLLKPDFFQPKIFLDIEAVAFFNINKKDSIDIEQLTTVSKQTFPIITYYNYYALRYNSPHYFHGHKGDYSVMAITSSCLLITAFSKTGSAAYHAKEMPLSQAFKSNLDLIINTINPDIIKAAGAGFNTANIKQGLEQVLAQYKINNKLVLGGGIPRISKFYPNSGKLTTYVLGEKEVIL